MSISENTALISSMKNKKKDERFIGKLRCYYYSNGNPLIVIGPHWPFFACLFSINVVVILIFFSFLADRISSILLGFGCIIALIQLSFYFLTTFMNPGIPSKEYENLVESGNYKRCKECNLLIDNFKLNYHCFQCNVCIEGFDHHCPWTSKCIGKGNILYFYCFVIFTMVLFTYLILAVSFISPDFKDDKINII